MPLFWNSSTAALNNYFTGRQSAQEAWQEAQLRVNQSQPKSDLLFLARAAGADYQALSGSAGKLCSRANRTEQDWSRRIMTGSPKGRPLFLGLLALLLGGSINAGRPPAAIC